MIFNVGGFFLPSDKFSSKLKFSKSNYNHQALCGVLLVVVVVVRVLVLVLWSQKLSYSPKHKKWYWIDMSVCQISFSLTSVNWYNCSSGQDFSYWIFPNQITQQQKTPISIFFFIYSTALHPKITDKSKRKAQVKEMKKTIWIIKYHPKVKDYILNMCNKYCNIIENKYISMFSFYFFIFIVENFPTFFWHLFLYIFNTNSYSRHYQYNWIFHICLLFLTNIAIGKLFRFFLLSVKGVFCGKSLCC